MSGIEVYDVKLTKKKKNPIKFLKMHTEMCSIVLGKSSFPFWEPTLINEII